MGIVMPQVPWPRVAPATPRVEAPFDPNVASYSIANPSYSNMSADARTFQYLELSFVAALHRKIRGGESLQTELRIDDYHSQVFDIITAGKSGSLGAAVTSAVTPSTDDRVAIRVAATPTLIEWWTNVNDAGWVKETNQAKIATTVGMLRVRHTSSTNNYDETTVLPLSLWSMALTPGYTPWGWTGAGANLLASRVTYAEVTGLGSSPIEADEATIEVAYFCDGYEVTTASRLLSFDAGVDFRFLLRNNGGTNERYVEFTYYRDSATRSVDSDGSGILIDDGQLHRFSVTFDTTNGVRLYIDGTLVDTNAGGSGNWSSAGITGVRVGRYSSTVAVRGFVGDVRIFDDVRTVPEIQDGRNIGTVTAAEAGLTHMWACSGDDGGGTVSDQVGGDDLTLSAYGLENAHFLAVPQPVA